MSNAHPRNNTISLQFSHLIKVLVCTTRFVFDESNINGQNSDGHTALHIAAMDPSAYDKIQTLISANADPNIQDNQGNTALHYACIYANVNILRLLITNSNINIQNNNGCTPLHLVTTCSPISNDAIQLLIDCGADIYIKNIQ